MQQVLAGRYRLERQLGKGGMGSVWLAEHLALRSWVAVKLMDPAIAATPEGAERFRREAQAAASLRSAHVVQVLDYGLHETTPFLVMELLQGESLAACLERERRLTPDRTLAIMTQVARALGRAHAAGIVHRDLKPDNVFLVREDDQELVKILDFGIAKTPAAKFGGLETRTGVTMGTPYYMSPEQVEGKKAVDHRTDLWAMAVITAECLTGVRPFDGETYGELLLNICARPIPVPSSIGPVPGAFDAWFARATSRDPEQRFASAQELASALREVVSGTQAALLASAARLSTGTAHMAHPPSGAVATPAAATPAALASAPVTHTSQPLEVTKNMPARSALPWVLVGGAALFGAGLGALLLLRQKPAETAESVASIEPAPTAPPAKELAPSTPPAAAPATATPSPAVKTSPASSPPAAAPPSTASPEAPSLAPPTAQRPATLPQIPLPPAPAAPAARTARCFTDPFSGQIRLSGSGRGPEGATFPCKQDPFTGKYKKL